MNRLRALWGGFKAHLGKILSTVGVAVMGLDLTSFGSQVHTLAQTYLGDDWSRKVGIAVFVLLFLRTTWTGIHHAKVCK